MPLDIGYVGNVSDDGVVAIRIYYQTGYVPPAGKTYLDAPLVNGPRGNCLDVTNTSGTPRRVTVAGVADLARNVVINQGNPVTAGQGRSRTASALSAAGLTTRGSVLEISLGG